MGNPDFGVSQEPDALFTHSKFFVRPVTEGLAVRRKEQAEKLSHSGKFALGF